MSPHVGLWIGFGLFAVVAIVLMRRWRKWSRLALVTVLAMVAGACLGGLHGSWSEALLGGLIFGLMYLTIMLDIGPGPKRYLRGVARRPAAQRALRVSEGLIIGALFVWELEVVSTDVVIGLVVVSAVALAAHLSVALEGATRS